MTGADDHAEILEVLAAYALGAVPEAEAEHVRQHVADCPDCRRELEQLQAAVDVLPASVPQVAPPPELKTRLMEIVEAEAELLRAAGHAADRPPQQSRFRLRLAFGRRPRLALAGAGAIVAAAVIAVVLLTSGASGGARTIVAQVSGPAAARGAHASLRITGDRGQLQVHGLPAPAAGHVDELWVEPPGAAPQPAGTFVLQSGSGSVQLTRPVHGGDQVLVTVEPGGGTHAPTTTPFIAARV